MVPYSLQAAVLGEVFRRTKELKERDLKLLEAWVWLSTYDQLFFGLSGSRVTTTIEYVCRALSNGRGEGWSGVREYKRKPLKEKFDFRHSRFKGLALLLGKYAPRRADGELIDVAVLLSDDPVQAVGRLIPSRFFEENKKHYSSFGNRATCPSDGINDLRGKIGAEDCPSPRTSAKKI